MAAASLAWSAAALIDKVRQRHPRVHCLTNGVAQAFTANALLALGAQPSMTNSVEEVADFVDGADALLVNLGTLDVPGRQAMRLAIEVANRRSLPWVLDPVFVERSPGRSAFAMDLIALRPKVLRGNEAEIAHLSQGQSIGDFARTHGVIVAATGTTDHLMNGEREIGIPNGHPLMGRVTAMGCANAALIAALLTVADDPFEGCAAAMLAAGVAGEIAAEHANGPGTFAAAYLDALHGLDSGKLATRARVI
jgi:hydroxyethylthiazole kinase